MFCNVLYRVITEYVLSYFSFLVSLCGLWGDDQVDQDCTPKEVFQRGSGELPTIAKGTSTHTSLLCVCVSSFDGRCLQDQA